VLRYDTERDTGDRHHFDLSVVRFMGDRIMVMNRGQLAEPINTAQAMIENPQSPYTQKLIQSIPQFPESLDWLASGLAKN